MTGQSALSILKKEPLTVATPGAELHFYPSQARFLRRSLFSGFLMQYMSNRERNRRVFGRNDRGGIDQIFILRNIIKRQHP